MASNPLASSDVTQIEAPVTFKAYLMCAFASFGGILFGYDIGYISGVMAMPYFIHRFTGLPYPPETQAAEFGLSSPEKSLITSILSAGTFLGALVAGDIADLIGRRTTVIVGCSIFTSGVIIQTASTTIGLLAAGRLIAGFGVGFESAIVILYMSEIAPRKVRGAIVSGYQFCITVGILLASCVNYATQNLRSTASYRIPIALQILWATILGGGLLLLSESPRYYVKRGQMNKAKLALCRLRGQPSESTSIDNELAEIVANHNYELSMNPQNTYISGWLNCFSGSLWRPSSNLRRTVLGTTLQMMQQWTGVNFIFYFGTTFFQQLGTIQNPFFVGLVTTLVNVCATPISFWAIERFGRRPLLIFGALGMLTCQFTVAWIGCLGSAEKPSAVSAQIAMICLSIAFFASTWGPGAWVVIGEIYPLPIRSRGIGLSTASNWLWNCIIAVITPYMVGSDYGNLESRVFFVWASLCLIAMAYAYFLVPETKGLSLEQVDLMLEEVSPRRSAGWKPTSTFAMQMGLLPRKNIIGAENTTEHQQELHEGS